MKMARPTDILAATAPVAANVTISHVNELASLIATALGIAYLLWRWRRDATKKK